MTCEPPAALELDDECRLMLALARENELFTTIREHRGTELALQKQLRTRYAPEVVSAALALHELQLKARTKFSRADRMWFDRRGLEQATPELVARHKAKRFTGDVDDFCCGIGADALALAERQRVTAIDLRPAACLRTWWNAEVYGVRHNLRVECADVRATSNSGRLIHIDPDRRAAGGKKTVRIEESEPGLEFLRELIATRPGGAIKLSPAANFTGKFPSAEIEVISLQGECKEATIWFGSLGNPGVWRATALPSGETLSGNPLDSWAEITAPRRYVFDPDPAIVRAGLIDRLAEQLRLSRLDDAEEYLTGDEPVESPFVRSFEVLDVVPYHDKALRAYFRGSPFGRLEIKCRHIAVPIEKLWAKLPLPGDAPGVLIVARVAGKSQALICRRVKTT